MKLIRPQDFLDPAEFVFKASFVFVQQEDQVSLLAFALQLCAIFFGVLVEVQEVRVAESAGHMCRESFGLQSFGLCFWVVEVA